MKVAFVLILFTLFFAISPVNTISAQSRPIIVDHNSVDLFDHIPENYINAARNLNIVFSDRSVGGNISDGLTCLGYPSLAQTPNHCKRFEHHYPEFSIPSEFPDGAHYPSTMFDRSSWFFDMVGDSWYGLTRDYVERLIPTYIGTNDIVTFQFSYLNVDGDGTAIDDIANTQCGFFAKENRSSCPSYLRDWHIGRIEQIEAQYPNKIFFHWTSSLARGIGTDSSTNFNNQMRTYVQNNNKYLLDVASILSHDPGGNPCFDNRDGVEYCTPGGRCENYPDDGRDISAICQHYTTETDGGHLGSVSGGKIRVAKAYWVLLAQVLGWDPSSNVTFTPTPTPTLILTPTNTPTTTASPEPTPIPGDANGDGSVDGLDYVIWLNNYGRTDASGPSQGDFNGDSKVDGLDYVIWLNNYDT